MNNKMTLATRRMLEIKSGMRYCTGCTHAVQYVSLEEMVYRNNLKVCVRGCEVSPNLLASEVESCDSVAAKALPNLSRHALGVNLASVGGR